MSTDRSSSPPPARPAAPSASDPYELNPTAHDSPPLPPAADPGRALLGARAPAPRAAAGPTRFTPPPRPGGWLSAWALLLITMLAAVPAIAIDLLQAIVTNPREAQTIACAMETAQRQRILASAGGFFRAEQMVPHLHQEPRYDLPPGAIWLQMLAFAGLDHPGATVERYIIHARLAALVMALLALGGVFWIGHSIGRSQTAAFAALITAANPLFVSSARLATPDIFHLGWAMLAIGGAAWAIRPLRPLPSTERQFIGWITCGLALGFATLTAGPVTLATIVAPIFVLIVLCPDRVSHLIGLLAALLIGVLLAMPWLLYGHEHDPHAWEAWIRLILPVQPLDGGSLLERLRDEGTHFALSYLPWTLWLPVLLIQPLSASSSGVRINLFLGWSWMLVLALLLLPMPGENGNHQLLMLAPAASIFIAHCFYHFSELAAAGRYPRTWRWMRWVHLLLITLMTGATPWLVVAQRTLVEQGLLPRPLVVNPGWMMLGAVTACLLLIMVLSVQGVLKHYPARALICWAMWNLALMTAFALPYSRANEHGLIVREEAQRLQRLLAGADAYWLLRDVDPQPIDPVVSLYLNRPAPGLALSRVGSVVSQGAAQAEPRPLLLVGARDLKPSADFVALGELPSSRLVIWRYNPRPAPDPAPAAAPEETIAPAGEASPPEPAAKSSTAPLSSSPELETSPAVPAAAPDTSP